MKDYLPVLISVVFLALQFSAAKMYQNKAGVTLSAGLRFNAVTGLLTALIFAAANGFSLAFTPYSAILAAVMSLCVLIYTLLGFRMMNGGRIAEYTLFLMTGGMTVPYIWGLTVFKEPFSLLHTVGLLLIIGGVIVANVKKGGTDIRYLITGAAVFFLNGAVSIISKTHQTETVLPTVSSSVFVVMTALSKFIFCFAALIVIKLASEKKKDGEKHLLFPPIKVLPFIAGAALFDGISYYLQLIGAKNLPATVLYPMVTGGCIILTAVAGRVFFGEKPGKQLIAGIVLCFLGTCALL